jgi:hypothetical protein
MNNKRYSWTSNRFLAEGTEACVFCWEDLVDLFSCGEFWSDFVIEEAHFWVCFGVSFEAVVKPWFDDFFTTEVILYSKNGATTTQLEARSSWNVIAPLSTH